MDTELLEAKILPAWFSYPEDFQRETRCGLRDVGPWQILEGKWLHVRYEGLKKRFPDRSLVPFARHLDNDDIACWDQKTFPKVQAIHDFCAPGWEDLESYPSFEAWLFVAQKEARDIED